MNRTNIGRIMILIGALVWLPYFTLKLSGAAVEIGPFLLVHLLFVIPGSLLAPGENIYSRLSRWFKGKKDQP